MVLNNSPHVRSRQFVRRSVAAGLVGLLALIGGASAGALEASSLTGTIAFVCEQPDGDDELCFMGADGTSVERITENVGPDRAPTWSPDGTSLVFNSRRGDHPSRPQIYTYDALSGTTQRVTDSAVDDSRGSWTPDGTGVVFQRGSFTTGFELFRQSIGSSSAVKLTDNPGRINAAGFYSPDGTRLVLQSNRAVAGLFPFLSYIIEGDLATPIATSVTSSHDGPRWSPDGDHVVFAAGGTLYVYDMASAEVEAVTDGEFSDSSPAWSPDGSKLIFQSNRLDPDPDDDDDITSIHVIDLIDGDVVDLGEGRTPVWSPYDRTPANSPDPAPAPGPGVPGPPIATAPPVAVAISARPTFTG